MSEELITVKLPLQPIIYLDRKLGRPDAMKGAEAYVGLDTKGVPTVFQRQPSYSSGGFFGCSGYYQTLPQAEQEKFKHLAKGELIRVTVTW